MKSIICALLIAGLAIVTTAQANELTLDEKCALHTTVTWPVLQEQATKAPDLYMLIAQGWKLSDVLREIDSSTTLSATPSLRTTAMYMDDHADKFRELSDEQMIDWWTNELKTKI